MTGQHGYPRPQLERESWISLDGVWDFAIDADNQHTVPGDVQWDRTITVPFAPETSASGIGETGFFRSCWYGRLFDAPELAPGQRLILHFGAVDYAATVWVNDIVVTRHKGGYTPFRADITSYLDPGGPQSLVVLAEDDPFDLAKPRGKQDWQRDPHSIWYPRTSGIWQPVWMEVIGPVSIAKVNWSSSLDNWEIVLEAYFDGAVRDDLTLHVVLTTGEKLVADDTYRVIANETHRRIALSDPGIDDYRNELLWRPAQPTLINAVIELRDAAGVIIDRVKSYTAIRSVAIQGDRFLLNGRPYELRFVLDQGYWPETGLTPPDDDAVRRDVELAKSMGFNGVRKHQKIEDPRYLYWADMLGLLVWEEMPSAYRFTKRSVERLTREWIEAIERDRSHPCIIAWVPFNESWGVPDLPTIEAQRQYVQALYHLTRTLDPSRPVIGNDGWESVATDIIGIHDYDADPERIRRRYGASEALPHLLRRERPGGRILTLSEMPAGDQPIMLTEFGGIALATDGSDTWGYSVSADTQAFADSVTQLIGTVRSLSLFTGFCYTQFTDTYQEANGLLRADRTPKIPIDLLRSVIAGPTPLGFTVNPIAIQAAMLNAGQPPSPPAIGR